MVVSWTVEGNEAELIAQCLKNDALAQKHMYEWLAPRMHAVCLRYIADREAARDVLHDGFITLFAKLDTYKGDGSLVCLALRYACRASIICWTCWIGTPYLPFGKTMPLGRRSTRSCATATPV